MKLEEFERVIREEFDTFTNTDKSIDWNDKKTGITRLTLLYDILKEIKKFKGNNIL